MTLKEVKNLAEPDKEKLCAVVRKFHAQKKLSRFHGQHPGTASLGQLRTWQEEKKRNIMREQVWDQVPEFADPMPSAAEFISGIPHKNSDPKNHGHPLGRGASVCFKQDALLHQASTANARGDRGFSGLAFSSGFP